MEKKMFRELYANEIECRVASISEKGLTLLLYKDARVDQRILDETVGVMNWQRSHSRDNANCTVSLWDDNKKMWISKEDTGKESYTEAEKGLASDSFKRACFNWGIGRELYSAPFIYINAADCNIKPYKGKHACYDKFIVKEIKYDNNGDISALTIYNKDKNRIVYKYGEVKQYVPDLKAIQQKIKDCGMEGKESDILKAMGKKNFKEFSETDVLSLFSRLEASKQ